VDIEVYPLTKERWGDLVELFGRPGASIPRHCWCTAYRGGDIEYSRSGDANRAALQSLVDRGDVPGLIGYEEGRPVGWVAVGPREDFARLQRSPIAKPVDDTPVWSVTCFFVDSRARGRGVAEALLAGAITYAQARGATLLEAYPVDKAERSSDMSLWWGTKTMYDRAGFHEVARRKQTRPVVRKPLG